MASPAATGLTPAEGRRFAFTLAPAFGLLGALMGWRGHARLAYAAYAIAAVLAIAGLLTPSRLGPAQAGWTRLGVAMSRVTTPIVLGVVYYLLITPTGLLRRTFGRSPLARDRNAESFWIRRPAVDPTTARSAMQRQF